MPVDEASRPRAKSLPDALADDLEANFESLVLAFQNSLYSFALATTGDPGRAEDAVQEGFLRAYRALCGYDACRIASLALRPWLYRIVLNVCRSGLARRRREPQPWAEPPEVADGREGPEAAVLRRDDGERLLAALQRLVPVQRTAVVLRHVRQLSYGEIAAVMEVPAGTAKSHVHRGLAALRSEFAHEVI